jgi:hypothetical protein
LLFAVEKHLNEVTLYNASIQYLVHIQFG